MKHSMKTFMEFLLESKRQIKEAHFKKADFFKQNDQYFKDLIDDIVDNKVIVVGNKNDNIIKVNVKKKIVNKIKAFAKKVDFTNLTYNDLNSFNDILRQIPKVKTPSRKEVSIQWNKIWKGKYSQQGKNLKGGQSAKLAEAATAFCYNEMHKIHESDMELDDKKLDAEVTNVLKNAGIHDVWIKSSKITAKKIDLETKNNNISYIAAHVDGNDISDIPDNIKNTAKIFSGKDGISRVLMNAVDPKAIDMLYTGNQKDVWNKADIVLIANNFNIIQTLKSYCTANNVKQLISAEEINNFINTIIKQKFIIPISLKRTVIKKNTSLNDISYELNGKLADPKELNDIISVNIELPSEVKNADTKLYNGSCYLRTNNNLQLTFRNKNWRHETLVIEIQLKGARGGNGLALVQKKLNLSTGFYKNVLEENNIKSEKDYLDKIKELTNQKLEVPDTLKASTNNTQNPWFKRTAYKAILSFLIKYKDNIQKNNETVDLINMFRLMYNCASGANSNSIYWLIKAK